MGLKRITKALPAYLQIVTTRGEITERFYVFQSHFRLMREQCGLDNDDYDDGYGDDGGCRPPKGNGNHLESEMLSSDFSLTLATGFVPLR
jgi:hypothetical protein